MNETTSIEHRAVQADIDEYLRGGRRPRNLAERRLEREICYADLLKVIVEQADPQRFSPRAAR